MSTDLRKKAKNDFEKYFFKLIFGKNIDNVRKHTDSKFFTAERRRNYLMSKPSYHTTKIFAKNSIAIENKKPEIIMNNPVCLGLSILELNKILTEEFWYDYVKTKHVGKSKLCYMDTVSLYR